MKVANLGYPRIGKQRELKRATELYWSGEMSEAELLGVGKALRRENWLCQKECAVDIIPSNDFSFYDQVLDMIVMLGCIPERVEEAYPSQENAMAKYFTMARGNQEKGIPAMEMTKWFDTNYHYIVPEFTEATSFSLNASKALKEFMEAKELGITTRPVFLGPISFLKLGKMKEGVNSLTLLNKLLPVYGDLLAVMAEAGVQDIQLDEPCLVLDLNDEEKATYKRAYDYIAAKRSALNITLATYFESLADVDLSFSLPVQTIHVDLLKDEGLLEELCAKLPATMNLSCGILDGRNVWKADFSKILEQLKPAKALMEEGRIELAPSCSLMHCPMDLDSEEEMNPGIKLWLAFAKQKLMDLNTLKRALEADSSVEELVRENRYMHQLRSISAVVRDEHVRERMARLSPEMFCRKQSYSERRAVQKERLNLPLFPTTTIGSFPQTAEIRRNRLMHKQGKMSKEAYDSFLEKEIAKTIQMQEEIGLDVLVHGEPERNDMVEYFGERLRGCAFTKHAWVQSYGSRYVKPPIIYGDISRKEAMTVQWSRYAQSLSEKPVKAMLTGPVTILQWSFVRDDQARSATCQQIALAIRDEICDLERAGLSVIQIDEPALREGLPLRKAKQAAYLKWASDSFKLCTSALSSATQVHTHMCYSEFNDMIEAIASLDADVISLESARSKMELLEAFGDFAYPNEIGPGVYDIHSPRIPTTEEMQMLLQKALTVLAAEEVWVNPDCGLKTRKEEEVFAALLNMVAAAKAMRGEFALT